MIRTLLLLLLLLKLLQRSRQRAVIALSTPDCKTARWILPLGELIKFMAQLLLLLLLLRDFETQTWYHVYFLTSIFSPSLGCCCCCCCCASTLFYRPPPSRSFAHSVCRVWTHEKKWTVVCVATRRLPEWKPPRTRTKCAPTFLSRVSSAADERRFPGIERSIRVLKCKLLSIWFWFENSSSQKV